MEISSDGAFLKALSDAGLSLAIEGDDVVLKPQFLRLQSIHMKTVRRGHFKSTLKPIEEMTDDDILWVDEPPVFTAITQDGDEIDVHLSNREAQLVHNYDVIDPRDILF